ncbi:MAG: tol-pal system protein YbgF [Thermodesulfobacteriota bacterium]|nr:tol-pal system protein YbgF [Thermodesulfobacteriota bacterium]
MKNTAILFFALVFMCTGCVKQGELLWVEESLGAKIVALQKDTADLIGAMNSTRKFQANAGADAIDLRNNVQELRGATEQLEMAIVESNSRSKDLYASLDDISRRLTYIEKYMNITQVKGGVPDTANQETSADKEKNYSKAYSLFKNGNYDAAKKAFQQFLKSFPDTGYSDNAQFWVGECEYFEGRYEEAIVEYEGVIQNYPRGNKVPNAFLKQALSFLNLGDKSSAKLLLQRVIKDYPNTTPATLARKKLIDIK